MICNHKWHIVEMWAEDDGSVWADMECAICHNEKTIAQWDRPKENYKIFYEE